MGLKQWFKYMLCILVNRCLLYYKNSLFLLYFNREEFVKEKTEQFDRKDTYSDEEYGPGEALAVEEFTEMKDKINVIDNKFGICLK